MLLEGRELPLTLTRTYESRGRFAGPFGRGWDFSLNVRLQELEEFVLPPGFELPLGVNPAGCMVAVPGDVILYDGAGGAHFFRRIIGVNDNLAELPAYATDPAINELLGANAASRIASYFESPNGLFTILLKFKDGTFLTIGQTGIRMYFDTLGRITKQKGTSKESELIFSYAKDGKLDHVTGDRCRIRTVHPVLQKDHAGNLRIRLRFSRRRRGRKRSEREPEEENVNAHQETRPHQQD